MKTVEEVLEHIAPLEGEIEPLSEETMAMLTEMETAIKDRSHPVIKALVEIGYKDTKEAHENLEIGDKEEAKLVKKLEGVEFSLTPYDIMSIYSHICEVSEQGIAGRASSMLRTIISAYVCKDFDPEFREKAIIDTFIPESELERGLSVDQEYHEKRVEKIFGTSYSEVEKMYAKAEMYLKRYVRSEIREELHANWKVLYKYCLGEILPHRAQLFEVVGIEMPWEEAVSLVTERQAEYQKKIDEVVPEELQERIHKVERQLHDTSSAYM